MSGSAFGGLTSEPYYVHEAAESSHSVRESHGARWTVRWPDPAAQLGDQRRERVPRSQRPAEAAMRYTSGMSAPKPATAVQDPVIAAFENAPPVDEPISPEEEQAIREALASGDEGISTSELLERLRPKG
jgi:hypothetical protein